MRPKSGAPAAPAADGAPERDTRIRALDALRGIALCGMIVIHEIYDLCAFCGLPWAWFTHPVTNALQKLFAGMFILLAGISSEFSRSNVRRGLRALAVAMGISLVTGLIGMPIVYGVLHLLGTCMVLYGLTERFWRGLPEPALPLLCAAGLLATARMVNGIPTELPHLWMLGLIRPDFYSSDYFPLLPWVFVFLAGAWAGRAVRAGRLPGRFYELDVPCLSFLGRHSLAVYLIHQPVLYALTMLGLHLYGGRGL